MICSPASTAIWLLISLAASEVYCQAGSQSRGKTIDYRYARQRCNALFQVADRYSEQKGGCDYKFWESDQACYRKIVVKVLLGFYSDRDREVLAEQRAYFNSVFEYRFLRPCKILMRVHGKELATTKEDMTDKGYEAVVDMCNRLESGKEIDAIYSKLKKKIIAENRARNIKALSGAILNQ